MRTSLGLLLRPWAEPIAQPAPQRTGVLGDAPDILAHLQAPCGCPTATLNSRIGGGYGASAEAVMCLGVVRWVSIRKRGPFPALRAGKGLETDEQAPEG